MLSTAMAGCGSATEFEPPDSSAVELIVVSDGGPDALSLEWTGGSPDAAKWQYRVKASMKRTMPGWHVQKAFLEGHAVAFERLSGVPRRVRYDSLKAAVV